MAPRVTFNSNSMITRCSILALIAIAMIGCNGEDSTKATAIGSSNPNATNAEQPNKAGMALDAAAAPEGVKTGLPGPGSKAPP